MHFLYDYINIYHDLRQTLLFNAANSRGIKELQIDIEDNGQGVRIEHVSSNNEKICEIRHLNGNFTFYEKSIQSKDSKSPTVYQIVERDVQTD